MARLDDALDAMRELGRARAGDSCSFDDEYAAFAAAVDALIDLLPEGDHDALMEAMTEGETEAIERLY